MDAIIINKKGGGQYPLLSYTDSFAVISAEQQQELMGQDVLNITLKSAVKIDFKIGDYVEVFGERYTLNALPTMDKISDRQFDYTLIFEGARYNLTKAQFLNVDSSGSDFSLMGNLETFAGHIVTNMNRVFGAGSWQVGDIEQNTVTQLVTFSGQNCLLTLQDLCTLYKQEFYIQRVGVTAYKLHIYTNSTAMVQTFSYGRGNGLYNLNRKNVDSKNIITRLYGFGSTKNIPATYRNGSTRLLMPASVVYSNALPYIELQDKIDLYGIIEGTQIFEEVFPHRTGSVSAIFADQNKFVDSAMPFNLAEIVNGTTTYLLPDTKARVRFESGNLAGYEFEVESYIHANQTFTLTPYADERGMIFPSEIQSAFKIQPGDEYTLLNINLPSSYINEAELKLKELSEQYYSKNSSPNVQYSLTVDRFFTEKNNIQFKCGNYVNVEDSDIGLNGAIQIVSFTRDLIDIYKYDIQLGAKIVNRAILMNRQLQNIGNTLKVNNIRSTAINSNNQSTSIVNISNNLQWGAINW